MHDHVAHLPESKRVLRRARQDQAYTFQNTHIYIPTVQHTCKQDRVAHTRSCSQLLHTCIRIKIPPHPSHPAAFKWTPRFHQDSAPRAAGQSIHSCFTLRVSSPPASQDRRGVHTAITSVHLQCSTEHPHWQGLRLPLPLRSPYH